MGFSGRAKSEKCFKDVEKPTETLDKQAITFGINLMSRENEGRERIAQTWASSDENYLKSIFACVILRGYFKDDTPLAS